MSYYRRARWRALPCAGRAGPRRFSAERIKMSTDSVLVAILVVLTLTLILAGLLSVFLINIMRAIRAEQQALRRVLANMDWTTLLSSMQGYGKESVRILDILDKRLQKLEALEKIALLQTTSQPKPPKR